MSLYIFLLYFQGYDYQYKIGNQYRIINSNHINHQPNGVWTNYT
jgi:hypothetical protein